ncbi:MAG: restriction endonuclease subunit S [Defluviitaleaceae bacterium]|nr:restriction endonuclease subunit S [Defluviitaleaceae bacterium]
MLESYRVVSGPFGSSLKSSAYLTSGGVPFVRIENIRGGFYIDDTNMVYISTYDNSRLANSQLYEDDLILSKVGHTIGYFARVCENISMCNISENNIGIKLHDFTKAFKHYILAYLNTQYAQRLVLRRISGNAQPKLNVGDVCHIPIPIFGEAICAAISHLITQSEMIRNNAKASYNDAEKLLLDKLGMTAYVPSQEPTAIKTLAESLGTSGRLDAEYYQQKYMDMETALGTCNEVKNLCKIYDAAPHFNAEQVFNYIELADIGITGNIIGCTTALFKDLPSRARRLVKSGQVIVSSIEGSLQSCAIISDEYDGALCSTGFYVLDSDVINPETLLLLFKSAPIQQLLKKRCSGTILTAISKSALETMPLPMVDINTQLALAWYIQQSFDFRRQSQKLLDIAKRTVEIAIEDGEEAATTWLQTQQKQARSV